MFAYILDTYSYSSLLILAMISEAVPKKILELMNVPGLTRENVASHLQVLSNFTSSVFKNIWFYAQLVD